MNTTEVGNQFEERCYDLIKKAISNFELGIIPDHCKVFQKKGYYSSKREGNIIFDITIEVWPPGADRFTFIHFIECKNYSGVVPVSDLEEFYGKIDQVAGVNKKAVVISNSSFQSGASKYAKSTGMMLIEVNQDDSYTYLLHKTDKKVSDDFTDFEDDLCLSSLGISKAEYVNKIDDLLIKNFLNPENFNLDTSIKKLSADQIEEIATSLIFSFDKDIIENGWTITLERFKQFLNKVYGLKIVLIDETEKDIEGRRIYASCSFKENRIGIDRQIAYTNRYPFILSHEIGHYFLHNKIKINQMVYEKLNDSEYSFSKDCRILTNERNWLEWQANQFASSLLMPKKSIMVRLYRAQKKMGKRIGPIYVDDQYCNEADFWDIVNELSTFFYVNKTNIIYRLNQMNLIDYNYRYKTVGQIMESMGIV